jgi:alginate O-acetyltransferase complex protein AlgI
LCVYRVCREYADKRKPAADKIGGSGYRVARHVLANVSFLVVICYGWLLFRAHSFTQIADYTKLLVTDFGDLDFGARAPRLSALAGMVLLLGVELMEYCTGDRCFYRWLPVPIRGFLIAAMIAITMMGMSNEPAQFIYFQF